MEQTVKLLLIWFGIMSAFAFVLYGWDKAMAKRHKLRVPEAALLGCAAAGGAAGALAGMLLFHHKTRKQPFPVLVPLCLIVQAALLIYALLR